MVSTVISGPLNSSIDISSRKLLKRIGLLNEGVRNIDSIEAGLSVLNAKMCTLLCTTQKLDLKELCNMSYIVSLSSYGIDDKDIVKVYISKDDFEICHDSVYAYYPIADVEITGSITKDFQLKSGEAVITDSVLGEQFFSLKKLDVVISSLERITRKVYLYKRKDEFAFKCRH